VTQAKSNQDKQREQVRAIATHKHDVGVIERTYCTCTQTLRVSQNWEFGITVTFKEVQ